MEARKAKGKGAQRAAGRGQVAGGRGIGPDGDRVGYDKGRQAIRTAQARARRTADDIARLAGMTPEEEKKRKREEQLEKGRLRMKKNRAGTPKAPHELAVPSFLRAGGGRGCA